MYIKSAANLGYKTSLTKEAGKRKLGTDTVLLAGLITSFFYVLPLGRYSVGGIATDFRLYDIAIAAVLLLVGLRRLPELTRLWAKRRQYHYWALLLIVVTFFSLILTIVFGGMNAFLPSLIRLYRFVAYLLIPGLIVVVVDTSERQRFLMNVFFFNIVVQACLAFAQGLGWLGTLWPGYWTASYGFSPVGTLSPHHLQIAVVMLIGLPLSASLWRTSSSRFVRSVAFFSIPIMAAVILFSGTRSVWVALPPMLFIYIYKHGFKGFGGLVFFALMVGVLFWTQRDLIQSPIQRVLQERLYIYLEYGGTGLDTANDLSSGRSNLVMVNYLNVFRNKPWALITGSGFQNIAAVLGETGAHNNFIQAWLELGVLGLIVYLRFLKAIWDTLQDTAKRAASAFERVFAVDSGIAFIGILVTMLANETLWAQYSSFTLTGQILVMVALATSPLNWADAGVNNHSQTGKMP